MRLFAQSLVQMLGIVRGHIIVQQFGKQRSLSSVLAYNKAFHLAPVLMRYLPID
jgi:hypothetical protein